MQREGMGDRWFWCVGGTVGISDTEDGARASMERFIADPQSFFAGKKEIGL